MIDQIQGRGCGKAMGKVTGGTKPKKSILQRATVAVKKNWQLYLMAVPAVVLLFCFAYMPMGGLVIAFKKYNFKMGIWKVLSPYRIL